MDRYSLSMLAKDKVNTFNAEAAQRRLAREALRGQRQTHGILGILVQVIVMILVGLRLAGK